MKYRALIIGLLVPSLLSISSLAQAEEQNSAGYSYFNFGVENIDYQEFPANIPVESKSKVSNFVIRTGGLYPINADFNFSIDAAASFAPEQSTEQWDNTETGEVLQKNLVTLQNASTLVLVHYKFSPSWQLLAGGSFNEETFKRFNFEALSENVVDLSKYTVEESFSHIDVNLGVGYGSDLLQGQDDHLSIRAYVGLPVWSNTKNTSYPEAEWTETSSISWQLQARYSIAISNDFQIGAYASYGFIDRDEETIYNTYNNFVGGNVAEATIPAAEVTVTSFGIELLWQL
jgi:hypothetical protein